MEGPRKPLYSYSWEQSPINKHRRANSPEEEKKIFDDWFEEKADEYFSCTRGQGLDDEAIRADASWALSPIPCNPEIYQALVSVSPRTLEQLKKPKRDTKIKEEGEREEAKRLAFVKRYEKSVRKTRQAIDKIKNEKRKKMLHQLKREECQTSERFQHPQSQILSEVSLFQDDLLKKQSEPVKSSIYVDTGNHNQSVSYQVSSSRKLESDEKLLSLCDDDDSDTELLKLALESSPVAKSNSTKRVSTNDEEISDEDLIAMMMSPVSS
ncbi:unnamed protein product [Thelazia callipaeda]|uniref:Protein FAM13A n=1 Tax=Thelazia callipaeda TaxID=103827 RepID=A0A0N5DA27_THECL|nr:unnamed protein product [Thelazia callipaeda]